MSGIDSKIKAIFDQLDTNKDGQIDRSELKPFFKEVLSKFGESTDGQGFENSLNEAMSQFDQNGNQVLELDEFAKVVSYLVQQKGYEIK